MPTHQKVREVGVGEVLDVGGVISQLLVLVVANLLENDLSDLRRDFLDVLEVSAEEGSEPRQEVSRMAVVDVLEYEVEFASEVLEGWVAVVELGGTDETREDVHGAVGEKLFGLHWFVESFVDLERSV